MTCEDDACRHADLQRRAAVASLATSVTLVLIKLVAVVVTGSVAVLSTLLDSAADIAASLVTIFGVRQATRPADHAHRFGHGKADALAALAHGVFISCSGLLIIADAGRRLLIEPRDIATPSAGIAALILCMFVTAALVLYQRHVISRAGSQAIKADCLNHTGDLLILAVVILSLIMTGSTSWQWIDPVAGLLIALWLFMSAAHVMKSSINELMDRELPISYRNRVEELISEHPEVRGFHDLRTRSSGLSAFIEVHCELDGRLSLNEVHHVMDEIEISVDQTFPSAEIVIHPEPAGIKDARLDDRLA